VVKTTNGENACFKIAIIAILRGRGLKILVLNVQGPARSGAEKKRKALSMPRADAWRSACGGAEKRVNLSDFRGRDAREESYERKTSLYRSQSRKNRHPNPICEKKELLEKRRQNYFPMLQAMEGPKEISVVRKGTRFLLPGGDSERGKGGEKSVTVVVPLQIIPISSERNGTYT